MKYSLNNTRFSKTMLRENAKKIQKHQSMPYDSAQI